MGRAARLSAARRRAEGAEGGPTYGDAARVVAAAAALLEVLAEDLRVIEYFRGTWANGRGLHLLRALAKLHHTTESGRAFIAALGPPATAGELAAVAELLVGCGLGADVAAIVAPLLITEAQEAIFGGFLGERPELVLTADGLGGLPHGRRPTRDGDGIRDDVRWWYRVKLKDPRDTVYRLAHEYAAAHGRNPKDAESVVRDGVQRAELWLSLIAAPPRP